MTINRLFGTHALYDFLFKLKLHNQCGEEEEKLGQMANFDIVKVVVPSQNRTYDAIFAIK